MQALLATAESGTRSQYKKKVHTDVNRSKLPAVVVHRKSRSFSNLPSDLTDSLSELISKLRLRPSLTERLTLQTLRIMYSRRVAI